MDKYLNRGGRPTSEMLEEILKSYREISQEYESAGKVELPFKLSIDAIDRFLGNQQDLLLKAAAGQSQLLSDIKLKFDLWREDYKSLGNHILPQANETLLMSIHEDLRAYLDKKDET